MGVPLHKRAALIAEQDRRFVGWDVAVAEFSDFDDHLLAFQKEVAPKAIRSQGHHDRVEKALTTQSGTFKKRCS